MKKALFTILIFVSLSAQDSVKVSLPALDREIKQREEQYTQALQDIKNAELKAVYLQGALDMLKLKREEFRLQADTSKTK